MPVSLIATSVFIVIYVGRSLYRHNHRVLESYIMRKSDKKIDNQLRLVLTNVCEHALELYPGFEWITHTADYGAFPKSLLIVCVFETEFQLAQFSHNGAKLELINLIKHTLAKDGIVLNNMTQHVQFDTEAACKQQHQGNWALRLATLKSCRAGNGAS